MLRNSNISFSKKPFLLLFFLVFSLGSEVYENVQMENVITDQIRRDLSGILPKDHFAVLSSVSLRKTRVKEVDFLEKNTYKETPYEKRFLPSQTPPRIGSDEPTLELPGFGLYSPRSPRESTTTIIKQEDIFEKLVDKEETQERYRYMDNVEIESVHVDVIMDNSVDDEKRRSIELSLRKKIQASYPGRGSITFQTADLTKKRKTRSRNSPIPSRFYLHLLSLTCFTQSLFLSPLAHHLCAHWVFNQVAFLWQRKKRTFFTSSQISLKERRSSKSTCYGTTCVGQCVEQTKRSSKRSFHAGEPIS